MKQTYLRLALGIAVLAAGCQTQKDKAITIVYPQTSTVDSADVYFGTRVPDPYRWLENDTAAATANWVSAERKTTENYLAQIPFRSGIKKDLTSLYNYSRMSAPEKHGDYYYFHKNSGLQNQDVLYRNKNLADSAGSELFMDPNTFSQGGAVT
jgi:prolyl oligopeptidase